MMTEGTGALLLRVYCAAVLLFVAMVALKFSGLV